MRKVAFVLSFAVLVLLCVVSCYFSGPAKGFENEVVLSYVGTADENNIYVSFGAVASSNLYYGYSEDALFPYSSAKMNVNVNSESVEVIMVEAGKTLYVYNQSKTFKFELNEISSEPYIKKYSTSNGYIVSITTADDESTIYYCDSVPISSDSFQEYTPSWYVTDSGTKIYGVLCDKGKYIYAKTETKGKYPSAVKELWMPYY